MTAAADPVLFSFRRCPYAMRARLALAVGGMTVELREILLRAKPAAMLEASPKGTVPVLALPDGTVIDESIDIMRWALAQSDPEDWLARDDVDLIAANDGGFKRDLDGYKYPGKHDGDPVAHRDSGLRFLRGLETRVRGGGQLCGSARGLADAAILPFVRQYAAVDAAWFDGQALPSLKTWLRDHLASPLFQAAMVRVPPWAQGDVPVFFPTRAIEHDAHQA